MTRLDIEMGVVTLVYCVMVGCLLRMLWLACHFRHL
jgi:hypothetical protein